MPHPPPAPRPTPFHRYSPDQLATANPNAQENYTVMFKTNTKRTEFCNEVTNLIDLQRLEAARANGEGWMDTSMRYVEQIQKGVKYAEPLPARIFSMSHQTMPLIRKIEHLVSVIEPYNLRNMLDAQRHRGEASTLSLLREIYDENRNDHEASACFAVALVIQKRLGYGVRMERSTRVKVRERAGRSVVEYLSENTAAHMRRAKRQRKTITLTVRFHAE